MANKGTENLVPQSKRTKAEQKKIAQMGGIASGKARQARKTLKEELLILLETDGMQEKICNALIKQASRGNTKAFEVVRDSIGEKPIENIEITTTTSEVVQDIEAYIASSDEKVDIKP